VKYTIVVMADGQETWRESYDDAVKAVHSFDKFVDHGTFCKERRVTLTEPNGQAHIKTFYHPAFAPSNG
jgi:hypothetical protein